MQVLIISGGSIDTKYALAFLSKREYDYVIAVDKGALFCWENGIRPRRMMRILRSHCRRQENFWLQESSRG